MHIAYQCQKRERREERRIGTKQNLRGKEIKITWSQEKAEEEATVSVPPSDQNCPPLSPTRHSLSSCHVRPPYLPSYRPSHSTPIDHRLLWPFLHPPVFHCVFPSSCVSSPLPLVCRTLDLKRVLDFVGIRGK